MATKVSIKPFIIGMVAVFIATLTLFFIFDSIQKLADQCETNPKMKICKQLTGPSFPLIIILLLILGLVSVVLIVAYILILV